MVNNIKDYLPEEITFALSDAVKNKYPQVLFEGANNFDELLKYFENDFNATFPEDDSAPRLMDEYEKQEIREEYCIKQENEVPKRMIELAEALDTAKRMKREAEERYESCLMEIRDLAAMVKDGTKEFKLPSTSTIRIALDGHYLTYSWVNNKMKLAKVERIPEWEKRSLWANEEQNRHAMMDLFGYDFPEVDKPSFNEETEEF